MVMWCSGAAVARWRCGMVHRLQRNRPTHSLQDGANCRRWPRWACMSASVAATFSVAGFQAAGGGGRMHIRIVLHKMKTISIWGLDNCILQRPTIKLAGAKVDGRGRLQGAEGVKGGSYISTTRWAKAESSKSSGTKSQSPAQHCEKSCVASGLL